MNVNELKNTNIVDDMHCMKFNPSGAGQ